jgi:hydroxyacylglutathione hydrolase
MSATLNVERWPLGELSTNCYLVWSSDHNEAIIIDPADNADFISERILELKLNPVAILLTHGHFDHVLGAFELKLNFDLPIWLHPLDVPLLKQARSSAEHWLKHPVGPVPAADHFFEPNQDLHLENFPIKILPCPGHTPGSVAFLIDTALFTGDTVFKDGVGRTDFSYSSPSDLEHSLTQLLKLDPELTVFPGHGEATLMSDLQSSYSDSPDF